MYNLFNPDTTLSEAESILDHLFHKVRENQCFISEVAALTQDDTIKLHTLLKSISEDKIQDYEAVKLSILVCWTFCVKYSFTKSDHKHIFKKSMAHIPQHHIRYYLDMLGSTFEEYDIATFGHNYYTVHGICSIIDIHSCL